MSEPGHPPPAAAPQGDALPDSEVQGDLRPDVLEARLEIETPERVKLVYELAGVGSRFAAGLIDGCILVMLYVLGFGVILASGSTLLDGVGDEDLALGLAMGGVVTLITWAYYLGFEPFWSGKTPGKHVMNLRVISDQGGPASVSALLVRNLLRPIDMLPVMVVHVLGGIVMFVNRRAQRIGDIAAGTVVVQERQGSLDVARLRGLPGKLSLDKVVERQADALTRQERDLVRRFVSRRAELIDARRAGIAQRIAQQIAERLGLEDELAIAEPERFLLLFDRGRSVEDLRDLLGPRVEDGPPPPAPVAAPEASSQPPASAAASLPADDAGSVGEDTVEEDRVEEDRVEEDPGR